MSDGLVQKRFYSEPARCNGVIKLDKDVGENLNLFVELGSAEVQAARVSDSEAFVGIGGRYVFGADRGATFRQRGLLRIIPGL